MKFWRKYHKWAGLVLVVFLSMFAFSGIVLNHRQAFSQVDISRNLLSSSYQYSNWDNAALKGSVELDTLRTIFYGNVGCWSYNKDNQEWTSFNQGFSKGIDNRKVSKIVLTACQRLFAGTLFGLFEYKEGCWYKIPLQIDHQRITDLIEVEDTLVVLTRSEVGYLNLLNENNQVNFTYLPTPNDYKGTTSLFKTIWVLHSGEILGFTGKLLVDFIAILFLFLAATGVIWFISPTLIKRAKNKFSSIKRKKSIFRFSVKWHNKIGVYTLVLLIFTTFTGMFLRPPLLIAIAGTQVKNIPNTLLDSSNAWYDQLRAIRYNATYNIYIVSTTKGMYALTAEKKEMVRIPHQPPVSVMGINVFEDKGEGNYLIGSFSGLYLWNPFSQTCHNYITGQPHMPTKAMTRPIGQYMATGYYSDGNADYYFDYNTGVQSFVNVNNFPQMPDEVKQASPLSFWNLALEIHTARIFQDLIGSFYILIIPLVGLTTLLLLISGLWIWIKRY